MRVALERQLQALALDNTQLLINQLWQLPTEHVKEALVARLLEPTTHPARTYHLPAGREAHALTKAAHALAAVLEAQRHLAPKEDESGVGRGEVPVAVLMGLPACL